MDTRCRHRAHVYYRSIVLSAYTSKAEHDGSAYIYPLNSIYDKHDDNIVTTDPLVEISIMSNIGSNSIYDEHSTNVSYLLFYSLESCNRCLIM